MNNSFSQTGAALLIFILFFVIASAGALYMVTRTIYTDLENYAILRASKQSYVLADGIVQDMAYRLVAGKELDATETFTTGGLSTTGTLTYDSTNEMYVLTTESVLRNNYRGARLELLDESSARFNFGVQSGNGGFVMSNSAEIYGNLFSNGTVEGGGSSMVYGDVISAGPAGYVDGVHATGSVWSHEIASGEFDGDAYYQTINLGSTVVGGTLNPGSSDRATTSLPIPNTLVDIHKASTTEAIVAGSGTLIASTSAQCSSGTYIIDTDTTFTNPTKIECDVVVDKKSTTLTLQDTLWVEGNLTFQSGPTTEIDPATSTRSVLVIVDDESDRTTSSKIDIGNGSDFTTTGSGRSYIVLLSMNNDAENGGTEEAITVAQSSNGNMVIYAGHGLVVLQNKIELHEVTGYRIEMGNNSTITYESGLLDISFTSGPPNGFVFGRWSESS